MAGTVVEVSSKAELQALCSGHTGLSSVLLWAPWHPPSMHLTKVLDALAAEHKAVRFAKCNTDVCADLASSLGADQVPFVAFLDPRGKKIDGLAGANPPKLLEKVKALSSRPFDKGSDEKAGEAEEDLNSRLKNLINFSPVMLFMKGSKVEPQCGFSRKAVEILDRRQIEYSTFDILKDDEVRQGLKEYSNWKTYPQLYIDGELIGGIDILKEMDEDGTLVEAVGSSQAAKAEKPLEERLHELINKGPVTLFMKGNPEAPRCGFSRKTVELLSEHGIKFEHFDILEDEEVRQGLKSYSNWPTYPQVYSNGKLVGGLDILKEMAEEGSLVEELQGN